VEAAVGIRRRAAVRIRLRAETRALWRRVLRYTSVKIGLGLLLALVLLAFVGPLVAPHGETDIVGIPFSRPSHSFWLGTDVVGRDVFSRILYGGRTVILLSFIATTLGYVGGIPLGLLAGYNAGRLDFALMRAVDLILAFPSLIFVLILVAGVGSKLWLLVVGVAFSHVPRITRIVRAATQETSVRGFVDAAVARGERTRAVLFHEILPNIWTPVLADFGIRLSISVLLVASLSFLGFGLQPPAADWARMINENRSGFIIQPYAVVVAAAAIGLLTIAVNLVADGFARSVGRSVHR
jgi:peptide/nickel transport system permease protein